MVDPNQKNEQAVGMCGCGQKTVTACQNTSTEEPIAEQPANPNEFGGPKGLEPTRYNDWERNGRCVDF